MWQQKYLNSRYLVSGDPIPLKKHLKRTHNKVLTFHIFRKSKAFLCIVKRDWFKSDKRVVVVSSSILVHCCIWTLYNVQCAFYSLYSWHVTTKAEQDCQNQSSLYCIYYITGCVYVYAMLQDHIYYISTPPPPNPLPPLSPPPSRGPDMICNSATKGEAGSCNSISEWCRSKVLM